MGATSCSLEGSPFSACFVKRFVKRWIEKPQGRLARPSSKPNIGLPVEVSIVHVDLELQLDLDLDLNLDLDLDLDLDSWTLYARTLYFVSASNPRRRWTPRRGQQRNRRSSVDHSLSELLNESLRSRSFLPSAPLSDALCILRIGGERELFGRELAEDVVGDCDFRAAVRRPKGSSSGWDVLVGGDGVYFCQLRRKTGHHFNRGKCLPCRHLIHKFCPRAALVTTIHCSRFGTHPI